MLKFNNDHIFTGYIKQLLASFNLPKYKVYTKEQQLYHDFAIDWNNNHTTKIPTEIYIYSTYLNTKEEKDKAKHNHLNSHYRFVPYIKDNHIGYFTVSDDYIEYTWHSLNRTYFYNKKELNFTKTFKIKNNIYDSYTHEYLGDYLRFQRDYNNLDLMPLYNCFSDTICSSLSYKWKTYNYESGESGESGKYIEKTIKFDTSDDNYKIYMFPVKLFEEYTIAIDSMSPVEICCGIYGKYQDTRTKLKYIPNLTYQKYGSLNFNMPVLYSNLLTLVEELYNKSEVELAQNEGDLKMFIKLPATNNSSIVVLEGNYLNYNDSIFKKFNTIDESGMLESGVYPYFDRKTNHFITNFQGPVDDSGNHIGYQEDQYFKPITPLQLLRINTKYTYPFADRLVEYLLGNAVTPQDELMDNITRTQTVMEYNGESFKDTGVWESKMRPLLYNFINNNIVTDKETKKILKINSKYNKNNINHDILGYVDKDLEKYYYGITKQGKTETIASINIYPDKYNNEEDE